MLKFIRVSKQFLDDRPALENVSFEVEKGELVLITGPSGSGKTTLLKLLTKELEPTEGEIYFGDQDLGSLKRSKVPYHRRKIGAVFQDYKLLPELNVWENIALALSILGHPDSEIEEKVTDLLKLVGLTDKAYLFPHQLSGGEAQRISIARALSTAPQVIFADEPTGNLDAENSLTVAKLLKKINELGTTVLVTTHDPVVIKYLSGAHQMSLEKGILNDRQPKKAPDQADAKVANTSSTSDHLSVPEDSSKSKEPSPTPQKEEKEASHPTPAESAQAESVLTEPDATTAQAKVKKHWGFFGIFRRRPEASGSKKATKEPVAKTETVDKIGSETKADHAATPSLKVESEDLEEDAKPKKSKKAKSKVKSRQEKED